MSQKLTVPHPKKKIDRTTLIVLSIIGVVLLIGCIVLGAAFDYALGSDGSIDSSKISPALHYVLSHPAVIFSAITKKDSYVPKMLFVGVCVIGIFALYKYSEEPKRLHRRGTEHGSAKWADEKEIHALACKEKPYQIALRDENGRYLYDDKGDYVTAYTDNNIVLAKEVYLALDTKLHRLNLNTLVIGGSGSGKTLFCVITNIMQLNTSFVITDPKGEIYQAVDKLLQEAGYEVRVFNTIQMEHFNNYNPFHYIYDHNGDLCEENVKKIADVLFQATKGDGEKDDFWSQKGQTVILALMFLLIEQSEYDALFDENGKIVPGTRDETNLNFSALTGKMRNLQFPPQNSQKPDGLFLTQMPGESAEAFAARQEKGFLCPLDREFLELQRRKPDTLAFRLYKEIRNVNYDMEVSTMPRRKKTETAPVAEVKAADVTEPITETVAVVPAEKPEKKPAARKTAAAKKPAAKTAKAATAPKETIKIQFDGAEYDFAEIKKAVEADCKSKVKGKIKSIEIYIKPEDKAVYYVVNGDFSDKIDL